MTYRNKKKINRRSYGIIDIVVLWTRVFLFVYRLVLRDQSDSTTV